ncbi:MAG: hypothetical protein IJH60_00740 [Eubacterium sp.]|nr:hypothetical protein [Eubacterium sp.]
MGYVDKHFRLTEETCERIRERDTRRYPLERDYVNEAILSFGDRQCQEKILMELRELRNYVEKIFENGGYR